MKTKQHRPISVIEKELKKLTAELDAAKQAKNNGSLAKVKKKYEGKFFLEHSTYFVFFTEITSIDMASKIMCAAALYCDPNELRWYKQPTTKYDLDHLKPINSTEVKEHFSQEIERLSKAMAEVDKMEELWK